MCHGRHYFYRVENKLVYYLPSLACIFICLLGIFLDYFYVWYGSVIGIVGGIFALICFCIAFLAIEMAENRKNVWPRGEPPLEPLYTRKRQ